MYVCCDRSVVPVSTTPLSTALPPPQSATQSTTAAADQKPNTGLIVGVVVGILVPVVLGAGIAAVVCLVVRRRRRRREEREKNVTDFSGGGDTAEDGSESTANLMFRLGGSRRYAGNPLFDTNAKTIQATAAAKGGAKGGGGGEAGESGGDSKTTSDGSPVVGDEDVSVAAKAGLKVVINTNVASQNFTKVATDC